MTNEERRTALNLSRKRCLDHATKAEASVNLASRDKHAEMATMWSHVANAMKDGDPAHDAPDGMPVGLNATEYGVITR